MENQTEDGDFWACSRCTYHNRHEKTKCDMCECIRPDAKFRPLARDDATNESVLFNPEQSQKEGNQDFPTTIDCDYLPRGGGMSRLTNGIAKGVKGKLSLEFIIFNYNYKTRSI